MSEQSGDDEIDIQIDNFLEIGGTTLSDIVMHHSEDILPSTSLSHNVRSPSDVVLVPSDLNSYRNRIDASVDEQRKYRQVLAGLNSKVMKYRQRTAKSVAQLTAPHFTDIDASGDSTVHILTRSPELLRIGPDGLSANPLLSSSLLETGPRAEFQDSSTDLIIQQLREEQIRNDSLEDLNDLFREQAEVTVRANQKLKEDLLKAQEDVKRLLHEREMERSLVRQNNEKNKRSMDVQHQHMLELWVAFNRLRRQVIDLRTETENDLDRQRTEFIRCANNMEAVVRQAEMKRKTSTREEEKGGDDVMDDLLKKYEDVAVRCIKLEHELGDSNRRVTLMENLVKKANEERDTAKDSLKKIQMMPELDEIRGRRARSISPEGFLAYFNTIRLVRAALQEKNNEIKDSKRKCGELRDQLSQCEDRLLRVEETRRKNDEEFIELKKENDKLRREKEDIERKFRRLNERFERLDAEKSETQNAIERLQDQIKSLNISHEETLNEVLTRQRAEFDERRKRFEDELEERDIDSTQRLSGMKNELEKSRNEVEQLKDQLRNAMADCAAEHRRVTEKENIILENQLTIRNLRDENSDLRDANDTKDIRIAELQRQIEDLELEVKEADETVKELRREKSVLETENATLTADANTLRANLVENKSIVEQGEAALEGATAKVWEISKQLQERDQKILLLEKTVADYELRIDSFNEQIRGVQLEQTMKKEEIERNAEKIVALNREKAKLLNDRSNLEDELGRMSAAVEELEKKIVDLERSIENHIGQEAILHDAVEQYKLRDRETSQALAQAQFEIKRLSETTDRIKSDHEMELERIRREYAEMEKKIVVAKEAEFENYDDTVRALRKNKEQLEKLLANTEKELKELSLQHERVTYEKESLRVQLNDEKERNAKEEASLRQQLDVVEERYVAEAAEWERNRTEKDKLYDLKVMEMNESIKSLNDKLHEREEMETDLKRKMIDLNLRIDHERSTVKVLQAEISKKDEQLKIEMEKLDQERRKWEEKLKLKDGDLARARNSADSVQAKCLELEKTLQSVEGRLNKKTQNLSMAEEEMKQIENRIAVRANEEAALKSRLAETEREMDDLKAERDELKAALQHSAKEIDEMKNNESVVRKEITVLRSKLNDEEKRTQKLSNDLKQVRNEKKEMETVLAEKANDSSTFNVLMKQYENAQKIAMKEIEEERQRSEEVNATNAALQTENEKLSRDLALAQTALEQKSTINQRALNDMVENYQTAEKARIDALREKETVAADLNNLKNRLTIGDAKRLELEEKLAESEMIRKGLVKKVAEFESSARKALSFAKARQLSPFRSYASETDTAIVSGDGLDRGEGSLRRSDSTASPELMSPHVHFDISTSDADMMIGPENLNIISSVEITFRYLRDRIDELEQAKVNESSAFIRLKAEKERLLEENRAYASKIHQLERKFTDLEEEKRLLESRLSSSRQLLVSQEESLRARENERKALKTRVVSADLHARDKEARLSSLNEQIGALKTELSAVENERKKFKESQAMWEEERLFYESACRDADRKVEESWNEMKALTSAKEKLEGRLNEAEHMLARTRQQCSELEKANREYRNMLEETKADEREEKARRQQTELKKTDNSDLLSKLTTLQHEYDNCLHRLRASDVEKQTLKNDLEEARNRQMQTSHRIGDMQHKVEELFSEKNRLLERLGIMEKREKDGQQLEKEIHSELEQLRSEKIVLLAETEELKRRLNRAEVEHREFDAHRARLERERSALKRNIETLEAEKQRTDAAIRQITTERQALDKSLTTMEKENMELYRNCTQLQNQVAQLEKENGSRLAEESATQRRALENKLKQAQHEKQQIEQLLEQRELAYVQKVKLCESKIVLLKEQLDAERKRRLDFVERTAIVERNPRELRSGFDDDSRIRVPFQRLSLRNLPGERRHPTDTIATATGARSRARSMAESYSKS